MRTRSLILVAVILFIVSFLWQFRESQPPANMLEASYRQAMGYEPVGTSDALAAVRKIASQNTERSREMLLDIVMASLAGDFFAYPQVADFAMEALATSKDPRIGVELASLIQPHMPVAARSKVARALKSIPCEGQCLKSILHYLHRVSWGEPTFEDRVASPPPEVTQSWNARRDELMQDLDSIIKNSKPLDVMKSDYGLGTQNPSVFILRLVARLELREACPMLNQTLNQLGEPAFPGYKGPIEEVSLAARKLECGSRVASPSGPIALSTAYLERGFYALVCFASNRVFPKNPTAPLVEDSAEKSC